MNSNDIIMQNLIFKKFKEFSEIGDSQPRKLDKKLKEIEKIGENDVTRPWLQTMRMMNARSQHDNDCAIENARKLISSTKVSMAYEIAFQVLNTCQSLTSIDDIRNVYKLLEHIDAKKNAIAIELAIPDYKSAQTTAMDLLRAENNQENICIAAVCAYLKAKYEKAPIFYQFCIKFLDKIESGKHTNGTAEIKAECLIEMGKPQDAIDFINSKEIVELFGEENLILRRLLIKAYTSLKKFDEVATCAEKFLDEFNADSIDEWRLVVQYSKDPKSIIEKHKDGVKRGPFLAEIELALKNNEDITKLLLDYAERYKAKNCVFGDIKKYITPEIAAKLSAIADPATRAFCTGKVDFEPTDGRLAAVIGEFYLMQYLNTNDELFLHKAIDTVELFPDHQDCQFLFIRLIGLSGCTLQERREWDKLRLEAIQVFSLAAGLALDFVKKFDLSTLDSLFNEAEIWYNRSTLSFQTGFQKVFASCELRQVESMSVFVRQIRSHIMRKFYCSYALYKSLLHGTPSHYELEQLEYFNTIDCFIQNDTTVLPIYFNDKKLTDAMYPSITEFASTLSSAVQYLVNKHFGDKEKAQKAFDELKSGNMWHHFIAYVDSGFQTLPDPKAVDLFQLGAIIICAKEEKKIESQKENLTKILNKVVSLTKPKADNVHPMLAKEIKEDIQTINASTKILKDLLK